MFGNCLLEVHRFYYSWVKVLIYSKTMVSLDNRDVSVVFYYMR